MRTMHAAIVGAFSVALLVLLGLSSPIMAQQHHWDMRIQDTVTIGQLAPVVMPWPDSIGIPIHIWADDTLGGFSIALKSSNPLLRPSSFSITGSVLNTAHTAWTDAVFDTVRNAIGFAWYDAQATWKPNPQGLVATVYFRVAPSIPSGTTVFIDTAYITPALYCEITTVVNGYPHAVRPAPFANGGSMDIQFGPAYLCGNANSDGAIDISDAVYLIAYIFSGGPAPSPLIAADANCDGAVDISDAVYLIAYIFSGGAAPCSGC